MAKIDSVEDLEVFKRAHALTLRIYAISAQFPPDEKYGLTSQMRRAATSICANLLEGSYRLNRPEYRQFVGIARGSSGELKYQALLLRDLGYITAIEYGSIKAELDELSKMLRGLASSLSTRKV
jgi:four helix bundle protein